MVTTCFMFVLPAYVFLKEDAMYQPNQFPVKCACGKSYTKKEWYRLNHKGIQVNVVDGKRYYDDMELRDCICESTLSVTLINSPGAKREGVVR